MSITTLSDGPPIDGSEIGRSVDPTLKPRRRPWAPALGALVALVLGILVAPWPPHLADETAGDEYLLQEAGDALRAWPGPLHHVSIAYLSGNDVQVAHFGAADDTEYEIGSLTKTMTGALLAESIRRGEVTAETRLGSLLDLGSSAVAGVPLIELATQSSGLPNLPSSPGLDLIGLRALITAGDAYQFTVDELLEQARRTPVGPKVHQYSNLGFALLGQALAAAAGVEYPRLIEERITEPLGLDDTYVPLTADAIESGAPAGYTDTGRLSGPWTMTSYAPAGGARSTLEDMVTYTRALLDGSAPGSEALDPIANAGDLERIGYAWFTTQGTTWHNGGTGGFSSFIGLDREHHRAIVVLSDVAGGIDGVAIDLLEKLK